MAAPTRLPRHIPSPNQCRGACRRVQWTGASGSTASRRSLLPIPIPSSTRSSRHLDLRLRRGGATGSRDKVRLRLYSMVQTKYLEQGLRSISAKGSWSPWIPPFADPANGDFHLNRRSGAGPPTVTTDTVIAAIALKSFAAEATTRRAPATATSSAPMATAARHTRWPPPARRRLLPRCCPPPGTARRPGATGRWRAPDRPRQAGNHTWRGRAHGASRSGSTATTRTRAGSPGRIVRQSERQRRWRDPCDARVGAGCGSGRAPGMNIDFLARRLSGLLRILEAEQRHV